MRKSDNKNFLDSVDTIKYENCPIGLMKTEDMWKGGYFGVFGLLGLLGIPTGNYALFGYFSFFALFALFGLRKK